MGCPRYSRQRRRGLPSPTGSYATSSPLPEGEGTTDPLRNSRRFLPMPVRVQDSSRRHIPGPRASPQGSPAEQSLWQLLRRRPLGFKFRRQHPKGPFFLDFFCVEAKLVLEVDGPYHLGRTMRDQRRDAWLIENGFDVLHLSNDDVLCDPEGAWQRICNVLETVRPSPSGRGNLLP